MRYQHRNLLVRFTRVYLPGALCMLALAVFVSLNGVFFDVDSNNWTFCNRTDQHVEITPLYTGRNGVDHVVPRDGWEQTEFAIAPDGVRTISLETGDFPIDRVLVETSQGTAWTIPIRSVSTDLVANGSPATPSQRAAKLEPTVRRLKLYLWTAAIPLLWTLPIVFIAELIARRRRQSPP